MTTDCSASMPGTRRPSLVVGLVALLLTGLIFTPAFAQDAATDWPELSDQAPRLPFSIPLLMVVGEKDPSFRRARPVWYDAAPRNPYSRFVTVGADHFTTPFAASKQIVDWIDGLPR